jgi:ferredoxin
MKARILDRADVLKIVALLRQQEYMVYAPFPGRGRDTYFDEVTDRNAGDVQIHLANPYYPPKRFVLPPLERMLTVTRTDGHVSITPTMHTGKRALFGIRSCDVAGIDHLDRFYLGREYCDPYYAAHRRNLFLVNVVCTDPERDIGDECFCMCADTGPAARDHFDLQLMDLGDEFMAVAGTPAGEALFSDPIFRHAEKSHVEKRQAILDEVRKRFRRTKSWFSATVRYVSQSEVLEKTWEEIGNRCLECGGCTYVCPACTCFTVADRKAVGSPSSLVVIQKPEGAAPAADDQRPTTDFAEVERYRTWDSCALSGFTRMAGGHNPRRAVHDRRNRRFFRKLAHYFIQRELAMACVGCGRCAEVCHGDVGMPSVVEMIRRAAPELEHNGTAAD